MSKVVCPYDKTHIIEVLRMPYHLMKCRKNFPTMEMATCPFNAIHEIPKPELRYHMQNCPDKTLLEKEILQEALSDAIFETARPALKGCTDLPKYNYKRDDEIVSNEWDTDPNHMRFSIPTSNQQSHPRSALRRAGFSSERGDDREQSLRRPLTAGRAAQLSQMEVVRVSQTASRLSDLALSDLPSTSSSSAAVATESSLVNSSSSSALLSPSAVASSSVLRTSSAVALGSSSLTASSLTTSSSSPAMQSSSSQFCLSESQSCSDKPVVNGDIGGGRGWLMMRFSASSMENKPGLSNSSLLTSRLLSARGGMASTPFNVSAVARGRSLRLTD